MAKIQYNVHVHFKGMDSHTFGREFNTVQEFDDNISELIELLRDSEHELVEIPKVETAIAKLKRLFKR